VIKQTRKTNNQSKLNSKTNCPAEPVEASYPRRVPNPSRVHAFIHIEAPFFSTRLGGSGKEKNTKQKKQSKRLLLM
jgi:hypothetical protein